jgi:hypothetical protein
MGLEYQLSYAWGHARSDSIGYYGEGGQAGSQSAYMQNLYDRVDEWGPAYFDLRHNFTASFVYDLPFGQKKKMGAHWNRAVDGVLGGWQIGGVLTAHTGFPLTIKMSGDPSGTGARSFRANVIGTPNDPHQIGPGVQFLDNSICTTAAPGCVYLSPAAGTFGDAGVGIVNGPGMKRLDFSLHKQFHITEHKYFELRSETFNLFNTPIFASPASQTITSSLFGQIRSSSGERNVEIAAKFYF